MSRTVRRTCDGDHEAHSVRSYRELTNEIPTPYKTLGKSCSQGSHRTRPQAHKISGAGQSSTMLAVDLLDRSAGAWLRH